MSDKLMNIDQFLEYYLQYYDTIFNMKIFRWYRNHA